jgi:hypothetical protein
MQDKLAIATEIQELLCQHIQPRASGMDALENVRRIVRIKELFAQLQSNLSDSVEQAGQRGSSYWGQSVIPY